MFARIKEVASFPMLAILSFALVGSSSYLFNPNASWNVLLSEIEAPAPELEPRLDTNQVTVFFDQLPTERLGTYLFYEGFVDALFYFSNAAFFLMLIGLALKRVPGFETRFTWLLALPLLILGFELFEAVTLLTIPYMHPGTPIIWLHASDIATLGKMLSYLATFIGGFVSLLVLIWSFVPRRS